MKVGNTIGWGVFYDENCEDDMAEQLCLVYVMFNRIIVDVLFVLQPEGGFVPIVLLQPYGEKIRKNLFLTEWSPFHEIFSATKVSIERKNTLTTDEMNKLETLYKQMLSPAIDIHRRDIADRGKSKPSDDS